MQPSAIDGAQAEAAHRSRQECILAVVGCLGRVRTSFPQNVISGKGDAPYPFLVVGWSWCAVSGIRSDGVQREMGPSSY